MSQIIAQATASTMVVAGGLAAFGLLIAGVVTIPSPSDHNPKWWLPAVCAALCVLAIFITSYGAAWSASVL